MDDTRKTVVVTLWRDQAEAAGAALEALDHPTVVLSKLKVGDFNGVSLSGTYATRIEVNPTEYPEVEQLQV